MPHYHDCTYFIINDFFTTQRKKKASEQVSSNYIPYLRFKKNKRTLINIFLEYV